MIGTTNSNKISIIDIKSEFNIELPPFVTQSGVTVATLTVPSDGCYFVEAAVWFAIASTTHNIVNLRVIGNGIYSGDIVTSASNNGALPRYTQIRYLSTGTIELKLYFDQDLEAYVPVSGWLHLISF